MAYKHCEKCDEGMHRNTLREALLNHEQECPHCHYMNELTTQDGFELLVEAWEENQTNYGKFTPLWARLHTEGTS